MQVHAPAVYLIRVARIKRLCAVVYALLCYARLGDWFGVAPAELTGRPVSTLGENPEVIQR